MTPRDRVLAAMRGEEVYPIAVDVFENGIHPRLRQGLFRHLGLAEGDHEGLLSALGACVRWARPLYIGPELEEDYSHTPVFPCEKVVKDIWGTYGEGAATYYDGLPRPLRGAETVTEVEAHSWPTPDWFDYGCVGWQWYSPDMYLPVSEWAARHGEYARLAGGWSPVFSKVMDLFGMEVGLTHLAGRPDLIQVTVERIASFHEQYYRRLAQAGRGYFDILAWGDDFASQQGLLLSPGKWREIFLPVWKSMFAIAHENGMKAALHACGSIRAIIGDLVDVGLDILEIVQVTAAGMDPAELKREFGAHLTFYGGVDTQHLLPRGTPEDVRREVRRLIDILGRGGRYIVCTIHYLMDDVSVGNTMALYDEARCYRPHLVRVD